MIEEIVEEVANDTNQMFDFVFARKFPLGK